MDVLAVRKAVARVLPHCRKKGPYILEVETYRYRGHSMSDPAKYRTKEEVQEMREQHDAIENMRKRLIEKGWASEQQLKEMDKQVREKMKKAAEFAVQTPMPAEEELASDIYA